jgi:FMN phosphatase YigB (HAD superfamily)
VSAEDPAWSRRWRAVIFDLWDTLVEFPRELMAERDAVLAEALAVDPDELHSAWLRLEPTWETEPVSTSATAARTSSPGPGVPA